MLPSLPCSFCRTQSSKEGAAETTSWELVVAEAAAFSIFVGVLTWRWTTSFGFKPSFFQVQGGAGLASTHMASSAHSGRWA